MTNYIPPEIGGTVEVKVSVFPHCDICGRTAWYDAYGHEIRTWANFCEKCAADNRIRLGTGAGQRFRLV
jgi:hypothetical protein